jgi:NAD(P)-dependent dehydrogenase (short-subunit alcohol dehydrogenase family)
VTLTGRDPAKVGALAADLTARFPDATVNGVVCDLRDRARLEPAFFEAIAKTGHCDLFVYVAGVLKESDGVTSVAADDVEVFDVNTVSAAVMLGLAANYFRAARRGQIVGISSIAGDRGRKAQPAYAASKAALTAYLEGLRNRLHPFGVKVTTVKPGFVATRMLAGRTGLPWTAPVDVAARTIARRVERGDEVFYVYRRWGLLGLALHHVPRFVFKRFGPA